MLAQVERAIVAGERTHRGQVCFAVEGSLPPLRVVRKLTPRERALEVFGLLRVWDTDENAGVLIYLLLADRDVEIVADRGIDRRVDRASGRRYALAWRPRSGSPLHRGRGNGVAEISTLLAQHFPRSRRDANEIPDTPVVLERAIRLGPLTRAGGRQASRGYWRAIGARAADEPRSSCPCRPGAASRTRAGPPMPPHHQHHRARHPVTRFLPAFGAGGKEAITLRHCLTHTGGFRMLDVGWPRSTWDETLAKICASKIEPRWVPGERAGYHQQSSWFVLGEVVRLIDVIALWDLAAKAADLPLWQLLGGARDRILSYASTPLLGEPGPMSTRWSGRRRVTGR